MNVKGNDKSSMEVVNNYCKYCGDLEHEGIVCTIQDEFIKAELQSEEASTIRKCLGFDVCGNRLVLSGDYCGPCLDTQIANTKCKQCEEKDKQIKNMLEEIEDLELEGYGEDL